MAGAVLAFGLCAAPAARALDNSAVDMLTMMHTKPTQFVLFDDSIKPLDFAQPRTVNICLQPQNATASAAEEIAADSTLIAPAKPVPLLVTYDGRQAIVQPGSCLAVETQHLTIQPDRALERTAKDVPVTHYRHPELQGTVTVLR
ncbi:MAG: hypothetical protein U0587_00060 [Candidatus Binatia bacterium]